MVLMAIYDEDHPTQSKLHHSLRYFMEYNTTKRLVRDHFVTILASSKAGSIAQYVPSDDPLENCRLVVLSYTGELLKSEGVYANPDEGMQRVRRLVEEFR